MSTTGTGTGVKSNNRLTSYMTPLTLYRVVTSEDGAVDPSTPPNITLIDASSSAKGLNDLSLFITPANNDTPKVQVWIVVDSKWYFIREYTIGVAGRPEHVVVQNLPSCKWAVVVTDATGTVSISYARSN